MILYIILKTIKFYFILQLYQKINQMFGTSQQLYRGDLGSPNPYGVQFQPANYGPPPYRNSSGGYPPPYLGMPPQNSGPSPYGSPIQPGYQSYPPIPPILLKAIRHILPLPHHPPSITIVNNNSNNNNNNNNNTNQNVNRTTNVNTSRCPYCRGNTDNYVRRICGTSALLWCLGATIMTGGIVLCFGAAGAFDRCKDLETVCGACGKRKVLIEAPCC